MTDLPTFLLARIAEDEAKADVLVASEVARCRSDGLPGTTEQDIRAFWGEQAWWRRQLAEIEAMRRIVIMHQVIVGSVDPAAHPVQAALAESEEQVSTITLLFLAAIYADHPDFQPTWSVPA